MKFSFGYPFFTAPASPEFLSAKAIGGIAAAAEKAGVNAVFLSEHPAPSASWRESGGHDALDPFVALGFAAMATKDISLLTNLTVVPYRNPLLLAKTAATLDVLSGGRLILGMGTGYLKAEYFALGVDFEERNELFDEAVEVLLKLWAGEGDGDEAGAITYEGKHFSARDIAAFPLPVSKPHPPFWLGGNSKLTRRRVAEWGQGWMPMPNPKELADRRRSAHLETTEELAEMIAYMKSHAESAGRKEKDLGPIDIMYMTFEGGTPKAKGGKKGKGGFEKDRYIQAVSELADAGVNWLAINASGTSLSEIEDQLAFIGSEILPACADL